MNDAEKALAGLEFIKGHPYLANKRAIAQDLCFQFNSAHPNDNTTRDEIIRKLIPNIKGSFTIKSPFIAEYGEFITLGNNFFSNFNCKLVDGGKITFGDDVLIGPDCTFVTANHSTDPQRRLEGYMIFKPITVGNNVWFGAGCTVCPGITIGDNTVIGAGSVVVKDIPANCIAAGNPCKVIKKL